MKYTGSIKKRLIAIILLVTTLTGLLGYGSYVYWYMKNQHSNTLKLSNTLALIISQDIAKLLLLDDVSAAADITSKLKSFENLKSMVLYKKDEKVIFQFSSSNKTEQTFPLPKKELRVASINDGIFKLYVDATYQDTKLGYIELCFKIESLNEIIKKDFYALLLILFVMILLSYLLAEYFAKKFTKPILNLVHFLEQIDSNDLLNKRALTNENNEYGKLYEEVNTMLKRIEGSQEALKIAAAAFETQSGIIITDKNRKILQANKAFSEITGYKEDEIILKTPSMLKSGLQDKKFYTDMFEALKKDYFWTGEIKNRHKNGNIVSENLTIQAVLDNNKEVKYYVASFLDITKQREAEKKLLEKERMLVHQSKMAAMGEMLGNIAHQWRQPLSVISTISTSLQLQKEIRISNLSESDVEQLKKIEETIYYLSETIEDFRDFFRPDKEKNIFNLAQCYKKTMNLLQSKFQSHDIKFIENIDKSLNIYNLENQLMQVLMNILNNAKDAFENKSIENRFIFITIKKENRNVILTIRDNAGGIPEDIIDKVFDPYFTTKHKSQGTGIGLYMSLEMITKHLDGLLEVKNMQYVYKHKEYKGACFKITLAQK